jgi:hypothetical protein
MKVRLSQSGSALRNVAYVEREPGDWVPVVWWTKGGPCDYEISDEASKREIAAVQLAIGCESVRWHNGEFTTSEGGPK